MMDESEKDPSDAELKAVEGELVEEPVKALPPPDPNRAASLPVTTDGLTAYMAAIGKIPLLTPEQELKLAQHYKATGDVEAAHKLVTSNLRFVVKVAYEYAHYGMKMADLIQEGNIGMMQAVKKFDPDRGFRLITYAVWWIRAYIQNYILKSWSLVKMGTTQGQRKLFYKLSQAKRALQQMTGEELDWHGREQLAKQLDVSEAELTQMDQRLAGHDISLDAPLGAETTTSRLDLLQAPEGVSLDEALEQKQEITELRGKLDVILASLNEKERFIVEHRLMTDEPLTLQEIGEKFHFSRERARQIEERAKKKIRLALGGKGDLEPLS